MDQSLTICLLGEFSLAQGGQRITTLNAERPQSLLAYLLLHRHTPLSRQRLAYTFWPDSSDEQARTNLRNLLHTLRRTLPEAERYLRLDTHTVQWQPQASYTLDVAEFQDAVAAVHQAETLYGRQHALQTAVSLYKGPLLPGNYDDWLLPIREELQQTYLNALSQCTRLLAELGEYAAAVPYARLLQREDPLSETAVILLMQLYAQMGEQTAVHRTYQACVATLREELDAEPSPETEAAYATAQQQAAQAAAVGKVDEKIMGTAVSPRQRSSPRLAPQLPPQPTPFIGREEELAKLAQLLADPHCHLVTVVGPGGTGKTRLALQTAYGHVTIFTDGAAFISLAAVTDPAFLPATIAHGLQFPLTTTSSRKAQLLHYLADKTMLLVLDNVEQLEDKVQFLAEILAAAPQVKLLVTSRQRLNLQEEWVFQLPGLPLPATHDLQANSQNSAVTLFIQAAQRHNAHFAPDAAEWLAVGRICQLVDGMPLGLELAAPWTRVLSCAEIGDEIEKNLDILTSTQHNIPERHRSMRAIFNQSWQMLTLPEKEVFRDLSLFVGSFSREGAEEVAGATLQILSNLLDKSLVRRLDNGRYDIHELLRQYAASQLAASPQLATVHDRLATYYVTLVETAVTHLMGPAQQSWLDTLDREQDNLRAVLSWRVQIGDRATAVRLGAALGRYWRVRYRPVEGGAWLRQILALPGDLETTDLQAATTSRAMCYAGMFARLRGDHAEAESWLLQSIGTQRQASHKQDLGISLNELGMLHMDQGQFSQAQPLFAEWLQVARELQFPHGISIALLNLGMATHQQGELSQAAAYYQESLDLSRQLGLQSNVAMVLNSYSMLRLDQNELGQAREMLWESMDLNLELAYLDGLSWAFLGMLTLHYLADNLETAARLVGVLENSRRELGAPFPASNQLYFEQICADLQQRLGAESFATYRQQGRVMPLPEAVAMAR